MGKFVEPARRPLLFTNAVSVPDAIILSTAAQQPPVAIAPNDRIVTIDILRGLALFGVLMVNLVTEFRVSIFEQFVPSGAIGPPWTGSSTLLSRMRWI
jgi:hypothetical protein